MIQSLWNPFRDWNRIGKNEYRTLDRFKASETLLGIETQNLGKARHNSWWFKASETLLGIETQHFNGHRQDYQDSKPLKPF